MTRNEAPCLIQASRSLRSQRRRSQEPYKTRTDSAPQTDHFRRSKQLVPTVSEIVQKTGNTLTTALGLPY